MIFSYADVFWKTWNPGLHAFYFMILLCLVFGVLGIEPEPGPSCAPSGRRRSSISSPGGGSRRIAVWWTSGFWCFCCGRLPFSSRSSGFLLPFSFYSDYLLLSLLLTGWGSALFLLYCMCDLVTNLKKTMIFLPAWPASCRSRAPIPYLYSGWLYTHLVQTGPGPLWVPRHVGWLWGGLRPSPAGCKLWLLVTRWWVMICHPWASVSRVR